LTTIDVVSLLAALRFERLPRLLELIALQFRLFGACLA
jgi:hypothetical protein